MHSTKRKTVQLELHFESRGNLDLLERRRKFDLHFVEPDGEHAALIPLAVVPGRSDEYAITDNDARASFRQSRHREALIVSPAVTMQVQLCSQVEVCLLPQCCVFYIVLLQIDAAKVVR